MYTHLPVSPLQLRVFGNGGAPINEALGKLANIFHKPEERDRMSEPRRTVQRVQVLMEAMAASPIRNC
mgnify:CR=1 FL=1|jgi:type II secretory pathway component PulF